MISIIIPTKNRAYTLKKVADSYYQQKYVSEIIFIDDGGCDNTKQIVDEISSDYPSIKTKYIKQEKSLGAIKAKEAGFKNASSEYVLYGEDDAYLQENYTEVMLDKIQNTDASIISGRIIYLLKNEDYKNAYSRFGNGFEDKEYLNLEQFSFNINANIKEDVNVPFTHALYFTKKELLANLKFDDFYAKGNGYREETDFQINAFVNGHKILVTNETHCFHMHSSYVKTGGQRQNRLKQYYWNVVNTNYMYDKYFDKLKELLNIKYSKLTAKFLFAKSNFLNLFIIPFFKLIKIIAKREKK